MLVYRIFRKCNTEECKVLICMSNGPGKQLRLYKGIPEPSVTHWCGSSLQKVYSSKSISNFITLFSLSKHKKVAFQEITWGGKKIGRRDTKVLTTDLISLQLCYQIEKNRKLCVNYILKTKMKTLIQINKHNYKITHFKQKNLF